MEFNMHVSRFGRSLTSVFVLVSALAYLSANAANENPKLFYDDSVSTSLLLPSTNYCPAQPLDPNNPVYGCPGFQSLFSYFSGGSECYRCRNPLVPLFRVPGLQQIEPLGLQGPPGTPPLEPAHGNEFGVNSCSDSKNQGAAFFGNPIQAGSRNKVAHHVDYQGTGRLPLMLTRTYNSLQPSGNDHGIGAKWTHSAYRRIVHVGDANNDNIDDDGFVARVGPDGQRTPIYWSDIDTNNDGNTDLGLWTYRNGEPANLNRASNDWWTYIVDTRKEIYDPSGRLVVEIDIASGEYLRYLYSGSTARVTELQHSSGRKLTFTYSGSRISQVTDPAGHTITYHYQGTNLAHVDYPGETSTVPRRSYFYGIPNFPNHMKQYTDENGRSSYWEYDSVGRAVASEKAQGLDEHRLISSGNVNTSNGIVEYVNIRNPLGAVTKINSQVVNGRRKVTSVEGQPIGNCLARNNAMTYDEYGFYDQVTDFEGNVVDYDHDMYGNPTKITRAPNTALEQTTHIEYFDGQDEARWDKPKRIHTDNLDKSYLYDDFGNLIRITETNTAPIGVSNEQRVWTWNHYRKYNGAAGTNIPNTSLDKPQYVWRVFSTAPSTGDGKLRRTISEFNSKRELVTVKRVLTSGVVRTTTFSNHDANGRPRTVTHENGAVTHFEYTKRGWLKKRTDVIVTKTISGSNQTQQRITTYAYERNGNLKRIDFPNGSFFVFYYDSQNRLFRVENPLEEDLWFEFDAAGNVTEQRVQHTEYTTTWQVVGMWPWGEPRIEQVTTSEWVTDKTVNYTYDARSRMESETDGNGKTTIYRYNKNDLTRLVRDAKLNSTTINYNARNQLRQLVQPDGGISQFNYNADALVSQVVDPVNAASALDPDGFGQTTNASSSDAGSDAYTYDKVGNVKTSTDGNGKTTTYAYDALNRVTRETFADGTWNEYIYDSDQVGYLFEARERSASNTIVGYTRFYRNDAGEITHKISNTGGVSMSIKYEYDTDGRTVGMLYHGGTRLYITRDDIGRIERIEASHPQFSRRDIVSNIAYMPFGPVRAYLFGSSEQRTYSFDSDYRLDQLVSGSVMAKTYGYDDNNNITSIFDGVGNVSRTYDYDSMDRLEAHTGPDGSFTYDYDVNGNRTRKTRDSAVTNYGYQPGSNRIGAISGVGGYPRTLDTAGNTTQIGGAILRYNARNLLDRYTPHVGTATDYFYNTFGERIRKKRGSFEQYFVYGDGAQLLFETGSQGTIDYIYLGREPVAIVRNGSLFFIHNDHLARPEAMTNTAGQKVWGITANAFSSDDTTGSFGGFNLRFPGQYYDSESWMHYNYYRYYDPSIGRYITSDPIGLAGGMNRFSYAGSNPANAIDPYGLENIPVGRNMDRDARDLANGSRTRDQMMAQMCANGAIGETILRNGPLTGTAIELVELYQDPSIAGTMEMLVGVIPIGRVVKAARRMIPSGVADDVAEAAGDLARFSPNWGRNRLVKELHDQGFVLDRQTRTGNGLLYRNAKTGEEIRIMPKPSQRFRNDPLAKHESEYYYRHRTGPDQPWGPHTSIPDK